MLQLLIKSQYLPDVSLGVQMIDSGNLNAIAFWFDLHLDEEISITSAPAFIGIGGEVLADVDGALSRSHNPEQNPVRARGKSTLQNLGKPQEALMHPPCSYIAADGRKGRFMPARVIVSILADEYLPCCWLNPAQNGWLLCLRDHLIFMMLVQHRVVACLWKML